jgi:hypothetical protein
MIQEFDPKNSGCKGRGIIVKFRLSFELFLMLSPNLKA